MTALAHNPAVFRRGAIHEVVTDVHAGATLRLLPSGDGWSLVDSTGKLVFDALGIHGRRRCLEFARAHGALAVLS